MQTWFYHSYELMLIYHINRNHQNLNNFKTLKYKLFSSQIIVTFKLMDIFKYKKLIPKSWYWNILWELQYFCIIKTVVINSNLVGFFFSCYSENKFSDKLNCYKNETTTKMYNFVNSISEINIFFIANNRHNTNHNFERM